MSLGMGSSDNWRLYKQQLEQAQQQEELNEELFKKDPLYQLRKQRPAFVFSTALLLILKSSLSDQLINLIGNLDQSALFIRLHQMFYEFKETLERLTEQDLSMNMSYLQDLSHAWVFMHETTRYINSQSYLENPKFKEILDDTNRFIDKLKNFFADQQYPLAYYLQQQAGKDWIPFPFMKQLQVLYEEYQQTNKQSALAIWIRDLQHLIELSEPSNG